MSADVESAWHLTRNATSYHEQCTVVVSVFLNNVGLFGVYSVIVAQSTMMLLALFLPHIPGLVAVSVVSGAMKFFVQIMYFVMQPSYSSVYSYMVILCQVRSFVRSFIHSFELIVRSLYSLVPVVCDLELLAGVDLGNVACARIGQYAQG